MKTKENIIKCNINISNKNEKNNAKNSIKKIFYKTNPCGVSLIVLVITIIVIIILVTAIILTLNKNNPISEANRARYESDVANMQGVFTNTVAKVMAQNQGTIKLNVGEINSIKTGESSTEGRISYTIDSPQNSENTNGVIIFDTGNNTATTYYTGRKLPLYSSGETIWYIVSEGIISLKVGNMEYGVGNKNDGLSGEVDDNEIIASDNPMLQSWNSNDKTDFHSDEYRTKITKVKFTTTNKIPDSKIEAWDVSEAKDKSVIAWIEDNGNSGYDLVVAGKERIIANENCDSLFYKFSNLKEIENIQILDTSNVTSMSLMFQECSSLINLDLSSFNTSKVTRMSQMFYGCSSLELLNVSSFDVRNVSNMSMLFYGCSSLENLNLENFDTIGAIYMSHMFTNCTNLKNLSLSDKFYIGRSTSRTSMFANCYNLTMVLTLKNNSQGISYNQERIFLNAATIAPAQITINYSKKQETNVDDYIKEYTNSNIVKGVLIE